MSINKVTKHCLTYIAVAFLIYFFYAIALGFDIMLWEEDYKNTYITLNITFLIAFIVISTAIQSGDFE